MISIKKIIIILKCFKDIINKQQQSFDLDFRVAIKNTLQQETIHYIPQTPPMTFHNDF